MNFVDNYLHLQKTLGKLCVGIDPHEYLLEQWGLTGDLTGLKHFVDICLEATIGMVPAIKPQIAFFEQYGSGGYQVLEYLIATARSNNLLVISDAKRGDIGSTMTGYANSWLQSGRPLESDALTVNPFLGFDTLQPALKLMEAENKGIFVLAKTSNPEAIAIQTAVVESGNKLNTGEEVSEYLIDKVIDFNSTYPTVGPLGIVYGATNKVIDKKLINFNGLILAPGLGAQGASPEDLKNNFSFIYEQVIPISARGVLQKGPKIVQLQAEIKRLIDELN